MYSNPIAPKHLSLFPSGLGLRLHLYVTFIPDSKLLTPIRPPTKIHQTFNKKLFKSN